MTPLDHTHAALETGLFALESLVNRAAGQEPAGPEARLAALVLDCFGRIAPEHHREEERVLFPELRARAASAGRPELCGALYELEMEHQRMERLYAETLRPALEKVARGAPANLRPEAVARFAWIYRRHIRLEAEVLAPFAGQAGLTFPA